jgi:hypothetical protein
MSTAVKMNYNVEGYLTISDDLFISALAVKPKMDFMNSVWFLPKKQIRIGEILKLRECRLGMCDFYPHWTWWEEFRPAVIQLFYTFQKIAPQSPVVHQCYSQLKAVNGADFRPCGGYSDIYYIPKRLASSFSVLVDIFLKHQVFLEIAIPTIIQCLEVPEEVQSLEPLVLWEEDRIFPWKYFTPKDMIGKHFMHPTKWGFLADKKSNVSAEVTDFYCKKIVPFMHDPYGRF